MALSLGKTLQELGQLPESELDIWYQFYHEQPFGLWRDDWRMASVASTVANTVSSKTIKPNDFMSFYKIEEDGDIFIDDAVVLI